MFNFSTSMFFIAVVPVAVALVMLALIRRRQREAEGTQFVSIHILLPAREPLRFDRSDFTRRYQARWNKSIACAHDGSNQAIIVSDGVNKIALTLSTEPVSESFANALALSNPALNEPDASALAEHRGCVSIESLPTESDPIARATFACKVLLTVSELEPVLGYAARSAQVYVPKAAFDPISQDSEIEAGHLFAILVNIHQIYDESGRENWIWLHTHGMEQFNLPDVEIWGKSMDEAEQCWDLLANSAMYMIATRSILKRGDTYRLDGTDKAHRIAQPKITHGHSFGEFDAVQIIPASKS